MSDKKYFLGFWSRYRDEDNEPLYTVECFYKGDKFKSKDDIFNWWCKQTEEDEHARDWDTLDLEFVKEVTEEEKEKYEKDKQYDCRWR